VPARVRAGEVLDADDVGLRRVAADLDDDFIGDGLARRLHPRREGGGGEEKGEDRGDRETDDGHG
jgi:hypothetical protein